MIVRFFKVKVYVESSLNQKDVILRELKADKRFETEENLISFIRENLPDSSVILNLNQLDYFSDWKKAEFEMTFERVKVSVEVSEYENYQELSASEITKLIEKEINGLYFPDEHWSYENNLQQMSKIQSFIGYLKEKLNTKKD